MYYVYIIRCEGGEFYTGIAADIARRVHEHFTQSGKCAKYTRSHRVVSLEALWSADDRSSASKLERRIKLLSHKQKQELTENPDTVNDAAGIEGCFYSAECELLNEINKKTSEH